MDLQREKKIDFKSDVLVFWDLGEGGEKCKEGERESVGWLENQM